MAKSSSMARTSMAPTSMAATRRVCAVFAAGLLLSGVLAMFVGRASPAAPAVDDPTPRPAAPAVATTGPPTTAAAAPLVVSSSSRGPVEVPSDPYAAEPIQRIGTIEIPRIGLVSPIFHGITMRNIDQGPSHWPGSAMPGETGNAVFAGHRVTHTHPFLEIDKLQNKDQVIFTVNGVRSVYVVTGHEVVSPNNLGIVTPTSTPTATLFACHPPHTANQRYVVHLALLDGQS
jgi:sortase A